MNFLAEQLALSQGVALFAIAACFCAGVIRGFAGFGLSALAMAMLAPFIPPLQLVPLFWFLEMSGSVILMQGGWADANRRMAIRLTIASAIALPIGLLASLAIDPTISKTVALFSVIALAVAQLARLRLGVLASSGGSYVAGAAAGFITGISGIGGMVIALYAMARDLPARAMRGTLNIYLLGSGAFGLLTHVLLGTMDRVVIDRAIVLVPVTVLGVFVGRAAFTPRWERYYRPACLTLLLGLAIAGLIRLMGAPQ